MENGSFCIFRVQLGLGNGWQEGMMENETGKHVEHEMEAGPSWQYMVRG